MADEDSGVTHRRGEVLGKALLGLFSTLLAIHLVATFSFWASHIGVAAKLDLFTKEGGRYTAGRGELLEARVSVIEARQVKIQDHQSEIQKQVNQHQSRTNAEDKGRDRDILRLDRGQEKLRREMADLVR